MSPLLYEIIVYLAEILISGIFVLNLLQPKRNRFLILTLWSEGSFLIMLFTPSFSLVRIGAIAIGELILSLILFEDGLRRKLKLFLFKESVQLLSSASAFAIYSVTINEQASFMESCRSTNCTYTLLYLLLFSVLFSVVFQLIKKVRGAEFLWVVGTQVVLGLGEVTAVLSVAKAYGGSINAGMAWPMIFAMFCMVAANISVGILAPYLLRQIYMAESILRGKELSSMEFKYYEMSVENDKKLTAIRHDIANHIQTVSSLLKNGENRRGLEYVDELKSRYELVDQMLYCNNPVVNVILTNKKREAEERNIETHIHVKDALDQLPITDFDLSTVVCNLLDNAIGGCIESEQSHPRMVVEILKKNHHLVIRVLNSCKSTMQFESTDRLLTTKNNNRLHGVGMPIIANIAKEYRGDFIVSAQNGIFTATVVMSVK